jgi:CHAD domain-containing protein
MDTPDVALVPLDPSMPAIDGFRAVLATVAESISLNWQGTIDRVDPEALHDLRVGVRRTRTIVGQGRNVLPPAMVTRARGGFAWLGARTGPARDLDVLLQSWDGITEPLGAQSAAALEPVRAALQNRRREASEALIDAMQSPQTAELMRTWHAWVSDSAAHERSGRHGLRPLGKVVAKRIDRLQNRVLDGGRSVGLDSPADSVHELRKDAKKLRYRVECFGNMVPKKPRAEFVRRLKAIQDGLGQYQDAVVHIDEVRGVALPLRDGSTETLLAAGQLIERFEQQRLAALGEFTGQFTDYDSKKTRRALRSALDDLRH